MHIVLGILLIGIGLYFSYRGIIAATVGTILIALSADVGLRGWMYLVFALCYVAAGICVLCSANGTKRGPLIAVACLMGLAAVLSAIVLTDISLIVWFVVSVVCCICTCFAIRALSADDDINENVSSETEPMDVAE